MGETNVRDITLILAGASALFATALGLMMFFRYKPSRIVLLPLLFVLFDASLFAIPLLLFTLHAGAGVTANLLMDWVGILIFHTFATISIYLIALQVYRKGFIKAYLSKLSTGSEDSSLYASNTDPNPKQ